MSERNEMYRRDFYYSMLSDRIHEIDSEGSNSQKEQDVYNAYFEMLRLVTLGRCEGLLALDEAAESIQGTAESEKFLKSMIELAINAVEDDELYHIGMQNCISLNMASYDGLICLMYLQGIMLVHSGQREDLAASILKSMLPVGIRHEIEKKEAQNREKNAVSDEERREALIRDYSTDEGEMDEEDHTLINQAAMTIIKLPHDTMQKLLKETDNRRLAVAMKGWRGKARAKVFKNISSRLRGQLVEDMEYMGPVCMKDVEKETAWIMRKLIETDQENEYPELKVVLDIYNSREGEDHGED